MPCSVLRLSQKVSNKNKYGIHDRDVKNSIPLQVTPLQDFQFTITVFTWNGGGMGSDANALISQKRTTRQYVLVFQYVYFIFQVIQVKYK